MNFQVIEKLVWDIVMCQLKWNQTLGTGGEMAAQKYDPKIQAEYFWSLGLGFKEKE